MDAVKYIKEAKRICKSRSLCNSVSGKCPLLDENGHCTATVDIRAADIIEKTEKAVQIVEQWGKDHPVKTRQSEFLKMFPKAEIVNIERTFCVAQFDITKKCKETIPSEEQCIACRYKFWNDEVTDNE